MASRLPPPQLGKLAVLIGPKFTPVTLDIAVNLGLGVPLAHYSMLPRLSAVIVELCTLVNREGRIDELINGLKAANPNIELHAALDALLAPVPIGPGLCQALLLRSVPPLTLINRDSLRGNLIQLTDAPAFRAISISGPSACGKTHSKELIRLVAEAKSYTHVPIDVVDDARTLTLRQVVDKITLALRCDFGQLKVLLSDEPTDAQAAERFVDWISSQSRDFVLDGEQFWLIFDGLDRPGAASTRDNLVPMLLRAVANNSLQNVTLFLLGDNAKRIREARRIVLHEEATQMTRGEIRLFLKNYALSKGWAIPDNELDDLADYVIRGLSWPFDHTSMESISERIEIALRIIDNAAAQAQAGAGAAGPPPAGGPMPPPPAGGPVVPPPPGG